MKVTLVDYGLGNLHSLKAALQYLKIDFVEDTDGSQIANSPCVIVPGVAAFGAAIKLLHHRNQFAPIQEAHNQGAKLIGLCLGAQLFLEFSEESPHISGLGLVKGCSLRLDSNQFQVPNQGWHVIQEGNSYSGKLSDSMINQYMYFSHSFYLNVDSSNFVLATIGSTTSMIPVAYEVKNVVGIQFHPEKSGNHGLQVLRNAVIE